MSKDDYQHLHDRLLYLRHEINFHNYRYHVLDAPLISDYEFDRLLTELRSIEEQHPEWITSDSPSQRVGSKPADRFNKVAHPAPILSLANAFNEDEVWAWSERLLRLDERVAGATYVVEPKIDGLTVVLHYQDGQFILGATRGNGEMGEDVTINLRTIRTLPLRIPVEPVGDVAPSNLVVRGEVFMNIADFEQLNLRLEKAGEKTYLNPRNTAAGSLRQLDPGLTASRPLKLLTYAIVYGEGIFPDTQWGCLNYLRNLGFPVSQYVTHHKSLKEAIGECQSWKERRRQLPFEVDGMVIKINELGLSESLGFVGKDPRGAVAFKFPSQEVTTRLIDIGVNVGRTGRLTPYAILDPIEIGGVIVKQATLHNFDYIAENDIRINDKVRVKRAGEVIPYVIGPVSELRSGDEVSYKPPMTCPACGEAVENLPGEVDWYCVNSSCPEQLIRNLEHFVSRGAMDIVGMGIKIVDQLVKNGLLNDVADIYSLEKEKLLTLEGFAEKKVENLLDSIENSRNRSLARLITALGIRGVGEVVATDLAQHYADLDAIQQAGLDELQMIEGIGPNIAMSIVDWFAQPANQKVLRKLYAAGVWPRQDVAKMKIRGSGYFSGKSFVVTGTLGSFTRQSIKEFIQEHGGRVSDSVSKVTDFLVVGENPGSKLEKARMLGVKILNETELLRLLNE